jgi:enoyl-CoA hydratase
MLLAADLRIVARDARPRGGFLKRDAPGRRALRDPVALIRREVAAGDGAVGEEISVDKAVELGPAWESWTTLR